MVSLEEFCADTAELERCQHTRGGKCPFCATPCVGTQGVAPGYGPGAFNWCPACKQPFDFVPEEEG